MRQIKSAFNPPRLARSRHDEGGISTQLYVSMFVTRRTETKPVMRMGNVEKLQTTRVSNNITTSRSEQINLCRCRGRLPGASLRIGEVLGVLFLLAALLPLGEGLHHIFGPRLRHETQELREIRDAARIRDGSGTRSKNAETVQIQQQRLKETIDHPTFSATS